MNPGLIVALLAAVVGPLAAYLAASRKLSGKIATSEASDLWAESSRMREDMRLRITELSERVDALEKMNEALRLENRDLAQRLHECEQSLDVWTP